MMRSLEGSLPLARSVMSGINTGTNGATGITLIIIVSKVSDTILTPTDQGEYDEVCLRNLFEDKDQFSEHKDALSSHPQDSS